MHDGPTVSKMETVAQPLDCPFCGAPAKTWCAWDHWGVECTFCEATIRGYSTRQGAINAWNRPRRTVPPHRDMDDPCWAMHIKICCKEMAGVAMMNDIRQGIVNVPDGTLSILWGDGDMMPLRFCPCCGKRLESSEDDPGQEQTIETEHDKSNPAWKEQDRRGGMRWSIANVGIVGAKLYGSRISIWRMYRERTGRA